MTLKTSNITLPAGLDKHGTDSTAVLTKPCRKRLQNCIVLAHENVLLLKKMVGTGPGPVVLEL